MTTTLLWSLDIIAKMIDDGLLAPDSYLNNNEFTYAIPTSLTPYLSDYSSGTEPFTGFAVLNTTQSRNFRYALSQWDLLIAPDFIASSPDTASIRIAFTSYDMTGSSAYAYLPTPGAGAGISSDIWLNSADQSKSYGAGTFQFQAMLHEIGHALGLKHPFEGTLLPPLLNNTKFTVMAYDDPVDSVIYQFTSSSGAYSYVGTYVDDATPMVVDIAAIQSLYGADPNTNIGDTVYRFPEQANYRQAIYDAGGNDTLDLSNFNRKVIVDLNDGAYSSLGFYSADEQTSYWQSLYPAASMFIRATLMSSDVYTWSDNLGIAIGTIIENAIGGNGNDSLTGNGYANTLSGMAGDDLIWGGPGNDIVDGGVGSDYIDGGDGDDRIYWDPADNPANLSGGNGTDRLVLSTGVADPVGFDLYAHGFEYLERETFIIDNNGNRSAVAQDIYTPNGLLTEKYLWLDQVALDGTLSVYTELDESNIHEYSKIINNRDSAVRTVNQMIYHDDGTTTFVDFDETGTLPFIQIENLQDTQGNTINQHILSDDGTSTFVNFDVFNYQLYTQIINLIGVQGYLSNQTISWDDGTSTFVTFDALFTQNYDHIINFQNTQGQTANQQIFWDDGTNSFVQFDADSTQAYTQILNAQDVQNRTLNQQISWDDDTKTFVTFDALSTLAYTQITNFVDAQGNLDNQLINYDDGSKTFIDYDELNAQAWTQHIIEYATDGTTILRDYLV